MSYFIYASAFNVNELNSESSEDESAHLFNSSSLQTAHNIIFLMNKMKEETLNLINQYEAKLITNDKLIYKLNLLKSKLRDDIHNS
jgi:hypothetical protein